MRGVGSFSQGFLQLGGGEGKKKWVVTGPKSEKRGSNKQKMKGGTREKLAGAQQIGRCGIGEGNHHENKKRKIFESDCRKEGGG